MHISVVITTYNRYVQAKRAIISVFAQSHPPDEVIVVEDGSESGIKEHIEKNYPDKIRYINHGQNKGLAAARNTGLNLSKHDWITYLDDDNEWLPERLKETIAVLTSSKIENLSRLACLQVGTYTKNKDGQIIAESFPKNNGNLKQSIIENGASTLQSSFFFNKNALVAVGGFDKGLVSGIDHDIWMNLAVAGYKTLAIRKPLVVIHQDNIQTMMTNTNKRIAGLTQYVNKWTPTYIEWFGELQGKKYINRYFAKVIGRLASQKIATFKYLEVRKSIAAINKQVGWDVKIHFNLYFRIVKDVLIIWFPKTSRLVKKLILKSFF